MDYIYKDYDCPICGSKNKKNIYNASLKKNELPVIGYDYKNLNQKKTFAYVQCQNCKHVFASPRIIDIYKYYVDKEDKDYVSNSDFRKKTYSKVVEILKKIKTSGEILEIGSGMGDFIYSATNKGYNCTGLEIDKYASNISINLGHKIYQCNLKEFLQYNKGKQYDIIVMMGVIEHLEYPSEELDLLNKILKDGGIIVLWTGDYDSIYSKLLKKRWWYVIGQHIQLFSRNSLKYLFNKYSYELIYNRNLPYEFHYKYLDFHLKRFFIYRNFIRFFIYPFLKMVKTINISISSEILMIFKKKI